MSIGPDGYEIMPLCAMRVGADLGPVSRFLRSMPPRLLLAGLCPACSARNIFIFVQGGNGEFYAVEPFPEDSARRPR